MWPQEKAAAVAIAPGCCMDNDNTWAKSAACTTYHFSDTCVIHTAALLGDAGPEGKRV